MTDAKNLSIFIANKAKRNKERSCLTFVRLASPCPGPALHRGTMGMSLKIHFGTDGRVGPAHAIGDHLTNLGLVILVLHCDSIS